MCGYARFFCVALIAIAWSLSTVTAKADGTHGLSAFGDLKYAADFKHFDYVNADAPKGGRLALIGPGGVITFDNFNAFMLRGDKAQGLGLLFDTLMTRATDEPDALYGLVARSAEVSPDRRSVTFRLRPEARFADGTPVTAADIVFSFDIIKEKGDPNRRLPLTDVVKAEAVDPATVRYEFRGTLLRDLPLQVAELPVLSKAYYANREFDQTTLEPPLGSGPYTISDFKQGSFVTYKRRPDYWGRDLPVNRGRFNFDEVRYEYYKDRNVALELIKGGQFDLREEFTARNWQTSYDIPAVHEGRLLRTTLPDERPSGAQGFFINTRLDKFKDPRVRTALDYAFNFEWTNKNIFFDLYKRSHSLFENSELKAVDKPSPEELAILEPFRAKLAPEVFESPYVPPVSNGSESDRKLLAKANELLDAAGWRLKGRSRTNVQGQVLSVEFLIFEPSFEPVLGNYVKNLGALGVDASIRRVDPAQFERRTKSFDYDIAIRRYVMSLTPGPELKVYLGSAAADQEGSLNLAGVKDPVIDALIDKVIEARSRPELIATVRALDRVFRAGHYWVPHWFKAVHNVVHWNRFSWPTQKAKYALGEVDTWWYDSEKAAKLKNN